MFELIVQDRHTKARHGRLTTAHGVIHTPAFMPIGTQGTVKAVTPRALREITDEGVHFQNHVDGTPAVISPEIAMEIQAKLGSDIAMVLDECPPWPCERDYAARSAEMTTRWAKRCKKAVEVCVSRAGWRTAADTAATTANPLLFGIIQGE